jgi:hypothetical protein
MKAEGGENLKPEKGKRMKGIGRGEKCYKYIYATDGLNPFSGLSFDGPAVASHPLRQVSSLAVRRSPRSG